MKISEKGVDLIKSFEGLSLKAYLCPAGVWTIGYGHTNGVKPGDQITSEQAEELLRGELASFEDGVSSMVKVPLTQGQFDALVSFSYNVGLGNLRSSTLLKLLNNGDYSSAALQFRRWNKSKGRVLPGLTARRKAEEDLWNMN